ncbi:hypothetical protein F4814DRAFT_452746 [Daldinia grandis]|nr:hypothetical protein F4814DRAFT_452746 [Daldinia grandis]
MALEKERLVLDGLPAELAISIFTYLPNVESIQSLGLVSKKLRETLLAHESVIARRFVARLTKDDDPGVMKLAFIACKARDFSFDYGDLEDPFDAGIGFLEKYVQRGDWPVRFYQLPALRWLPELSEGIMGVFNWFVTQITPLPLILEDRGLTSTEMSRQRRLLYMLDFLSTFLTKSDVPNRNRQRFNTILKALWDSFSPAEIFLVHQITERLVNFGRLASILIMMPLEFGLFIKSVHHLRCYKKCFDVFLSGKRRELSASKTPPSWEPFVGDPSAFVREGVPLEEEEESLEGYYYCSPFDYERLMVNGLFGSRQWFFLIGDKDRCELAINNGRIWSWDDGTIPSAPRMDESMIQWHQDPAPFDIPGVVGTMMPLHKLFSLSGRSKIWDFGGGSWPIN